MLLVPKRAFEDADAAPGQSPLIVGLTGPSNSGKTWTALELATGMQSVTGGAIWCIDTESRRALHYAKFFRFRHVPFPPPHGPLDYIAAIDHCVSGGAKIVIVDSMSHEHSGEGGLMDQVDEFLNKKAGSDFAARQRFMPMAHIQPKAARKQLNRHIVVNLGHIIFILCYRAAEKMKWQKGKDPVELGWQAETTSTLPYDMTVRFLLPAGSQGVPDLAPETPAEKLTTKTARQFEGWFKPGEALNREHGRRLAEWAAGSPAPAGSADAVIKWLAALEEAEDLAATWAAIKSAYGSPAGDGVPKQIKDCYARLYKAQQARAAA